MTRSAIVIDGIFIDPEIASAYFKCDLEKCKGACCFMEADYGAPLLEEEIEQINDALQIVKKYLPEKNVKFIEENGFLRENRNRALNKNALTQGVRLRLLGRWHS
jgi:hypothetical protein